MKKIENELDIITQLGEIKDKVIIDVGCGTGELVRTLTTKGAQVTGIDTPEMLTQAGNHPPVGNENYAAAVGQHLPFKADYADMIIFFASLHHMPEAMMIQALKETHQVLKSGGIGVIVEPIGQEGSYFELIRLVEDEREIQRLAFEAIKKASSFGLQNKKEEIVYIERSFDDYVNLLNIFIDDDTERKGYLHEARKITLALCRETKQTINQYRFKSICRANILQKGD